MVALLVFLLFLEHSVFNICCQIIVVFIKKPVYFGKKNISKLKRLIHKQSSQFSVCFYHVTYAFRVNPGSSPPEVVLGKGALKICSKFTGEHPCRSVISIKLLCYFTEIALWHGCSLVNLLHMFRTHFYKNTYGGLLLESTLCNYLNVKENLNF